MGKPRSGKNPLTWASSCGAGDGNRTRTGSLGISGPDGRTRAHLGVWAAGGGLKRPGLTWPNGTLMARLGSPDPAGVQGRLVRGWGVMMGTTFTKEVRRDVEQR